MTHEAKVTRKLCSSEGCPNRAVQGGVCIRHGARQKRKNCAVVGCTSTSKAVKDRKCKRHAHGTNERKATKNESIEDLTLEGREKDKSPPASKLKLSRSPPICHSKALTASKLIRSPPAFACKIIRPPPAAYTGACIPLHPTPSHFQGDMDLFKDEPVPEFSSLLNFPCYMSMKLENAKSTRKFCVMCGQEREIKKSREGHPPTIPNQNKGVCTDCDVKVWVYYKTGLQIKWCKGCKNFRMWATFGAHGHGVKSKCVPCRERQRENYKNRKEMAGEKYKKQKQKQIAMMNVKDGEC